MSDLPVYTSIVVAERDGLINLATIADILKRNRQTVHMWMKRRRTSNFPHPVAVVQYGRRVYPLFRAIDVVRWHSEYIPAVGGAPKGNRNWVRKTTC